jgi:hypothetical protein
VNNGRSLTKPTLIRLNVGRFPRFARPIEGRHRLDDQLRAARGRPACAARARAAHTCPVGRSRCSRSRAVMAAKRLAAARQSGAQDIGEQGLLGWRPRPYGKRRSGGDARPWPPRGAPAPLCRLMADVGMIDSDTARWSPGEAAPENARCRSAGPAWPGDGWRSRSLPLPGTREYRASRRLPRLLLGEEWSGTPWRGSKRRNPRGDGLSAQRTTRLAAQSKTIVVSPRWGEPCEATALTGHRDWLTS